MNLVEALQKANNESREHLRELAETEALIGPSPGIEISRTITKNLIAQTEAAIASGDVLLMLAAAEAHGLGEESESDAATPTEES